MDISYSRSYFGDKEVMSKVLFDLPTMYYEKVMSEIFKTPCEPTVDELMYAYFISSEGKTYGYYTGLRGLNEIHGTTQVPAVIEIVSNKVSEEKEYSCSYYRYVIKPARVNVTNENALYMEILDLLENCYDYFEEEPLMVVGRFIERHALLRNSFEPLLIGYSSRTKEVLMNVFTRLIQ